MVSKKKIMKLRKIQTQMRQAAYNHNWDELNDLAKKEKKILDSL